MNRRDFLFLKTRYEGQTLELSCEQLYMRYLDSILEGTTAQLLEHFKQNLSAATVLNLTDPAWLASDELKPVDSLIADFRARGGRVTLTNPHHHKENSHGKRF